MEFHIVYSKFIEVESEVKLSPKELSLLLYLQEQVNMSGQINTMIELLSAQNKFYKKEYDNRNQIKELLKGLESKKAITIQEQGKVLVIEILKHESNFDKVPYEVIEKADTPEEKMLFSFIYRWQRYKGMTIASYPFIAELLEIGEAKAFELVEELVECGYLERITGAKKENSNMRFPNSYRITFIGEELEQPNVVDFKTKKKKAPDKSPEPNINIQSISKIERILSN